MTQLDPSQIRERERRTWAAVAEGWRRRDEVLRKGAAPVTERMLELAGIDSGHQVLDIASGTGEPAISAAHRAGDGGKVIGTDLVSEMLAFAHEKARDARLRNIEFLCVDGESLDFEPGSFDAVTIRWGLMFMPDPEACLRRAHELLRPGGRLVVACWAEPERNPFVNLLIQVLGRHMSLPPPEPGAPGIFAFADPGRLRSVMTAAGFSEVAIEELEIDVIEVENGAAYWATMEDLAGPVTMLVNQLESEVRDAFVDEVIRSAEALKRGDTLPMRGTTWIASASR